MPENKRKKFRQKMTEMAAKSVKEKTTNKINVGNVHDFIKDKRDQQVWRRATEFESKRISKQKKRKVPSGKGVPVGPRISAIEIYRRHYARRYGS